VKTPLFTVERMDVTVKKFTVLAIVAAVFAFSSIGCSKEAPKTTGGATPTKADTSKT